MVVKMMMEYRAHSEGLLGIYLRDRDSQTVVLDRSWVIKEERHLTSEPR